MAATFCHFPPLLHKENAQLFLCIYRLSERLYHTLWFHRLETTMADLGAVLKM